MENMIRFLIFIYYPQFKSPNQSRFESLFQSILKKEKNLHETQTKTISKDIYPEKIIRNEDKRTSILIKGIPMDMGKKEVRFFLEQFGNLNFLYIIKDQNDAERKTSIAYINFINYRTLIPLYMNLRNYKFKRNGHIYSFQIMYSSPQGKTELKRYMKNLTSNKYSN